MRKRGKKSKVREDYLRIILELYEDVGVRSVDIANELGIAKASVSEMLRKLARENLVKIAPYSKVFLTSKGRKEAAQIFNKHFIIKRFVENFFEHDEELTKEEAHKLEHALSAQSVKIINEIMKLENYKEKINIPSYVG